MAKRKLSSNQICYRISLALLPIMLGLSLLYQAGIFIPTKIFPPCMFHALTGFSCPGCGSTRAVSALLRGDLLTSLKLQPAIFYCSLVYTTFVLSHTLALLINGIKKKHPSLFKKGCILHHFSHFRGMHLSANILYVLVWIFLGFGVLRFGYELWVKFM